MKIVLAAIPLLLIITILPACDKGDGGGKSKTQLVDELAARNLAAEAANMELNGREMEAVEIYKKLAKKYPHTKIFAKLQDELFKKGISIENPNLSKTSQSMFKAQNMVLNFKRKKGFYPNLSAVKISPDAWGSQLVLTVSKDKNDTYEFIITSKGPDSTLDTEDDLFLLYEGSKGNISGSRKIVDAVGKKHQSVRTGRVEMSKLKGGSQSARRDRATGRASKGEITSRGDASARTKGGTKSNKRTGQKEVVISLEDL